MQPEEFQIPANDALQRLGAVFSGGRSVRFGGDKAAVEVRGRSLLEWSMAGLGAHVAVIVVCGRQWSGARSLDDRPHAGLGPLAALNAALHYGQDRGFDVVLTTGCDIPVYPADEVERLVSATPSIIDSQPLIGCWPVTLAAFLDDYIVSGPRRSLYGWADACDAARIAAHKPIVNINTRDDLAAFDASMDC